jgi:hypothetical protein
VDIEQRRQVIAKARAMVARIDREIEADRRERRAWIMGGAETSGEPDENMRRILARKRAEEVHERSKQIVRQHEMDQHLRDHRDRKRNAITRSREILRRS